MKCALIGEHGYKIHIIRIKNIFPLSANQEKFNVANS